jgi:hypothetical protein
MKKFSSPIKLNKRLTPERAYQLLQDTIAIRDGGGTERVSCYGLPYPECPERGKIDIYIKQLEERIDNEIRN